MLRFVKALQPLLVALQPVPLVQNFTWTPGATLDNSANANPSATPPAGNTVYTVQVTDVNGCQNTDNVTVSVNAAPTISAGADAAICLNDSTQLMATGGTSYVWTPATGLSNTTVANIRWLVLQQPRLIRLRVPMQTIAPTLLQ